MKRLAEYAHPVRDLRAEMGTRGGEAATIVTGPRSNHRRKAAVEVT
jgi:hypothetical protein